MRSPARQLLGIGAICAAMYYLDRNSGRRRRARLRDQVTSLRGRVRDQARATATDVEHRAQGLFATMAHWFEPRSAPDGVLAERARSRLGRCVSHPGAISVEVTDGRARVSGPVLAGEHARLVRTLRTTPGILDVEDRTQVHESGARISSLQGGRPREHRPELLQENWSPTTRLLAGGLGTSALLFAARSRGLGRLGGLALGATLLARTLANRPVRRLASLPREITIHKTLQVRAPVHEVFETLANYENFPQFMRNIRSVRVKPDGSSCWVASGPAGSSVKWTSMTTRHEADRELAWSTVPNSAIEHQGAIRVEPIESSAGPRTRVDVQMRYRPPAGALGHVIARLFGTDPRSEMDQDLLRLKTFLETGRRARDAAGRASTSRTANDDHELANPESGTGPDETGLTGSIQRPGNGAETPRPNPG